MKSFRAALVLALTLFLLAALPASAQMNLPAAKKGKEKQEQKEEKPKDVMSADTFEGLALRSIGPAVTSGRVVAFAVDPNNRAHYFVGSASGGVWKTENDGITFAPVFEHEGSYSIGAVAIDPRDSAVVWVGTGELNSQRSVSYGDGIYRSDDGGKSWKNMGLKKSEHIARIVIDPRNSNVVYVAAQGPLWGPGGDRGLFKTTDGGKTWKNILSISENTGVTDVALDPEDADVIYASAYQRRRHVFTLIDGGPESALYKSTDAGASFNKLKSGLPGGDLGRIGVAVSPADHNVVYAIVEASEDKGGIFRSHDRGATWDKQNKWDVGAMYYGQVIPDP
ncbi:MAG TPA: glycosyl hydrolase, partial [Terriglobales bacterium]|nr:glycosyl hydrolase [Terriglobales bacterium]